MPESFGARLRQQREARQIDLIAISEQTKIKLALLQALERGDVSRWPSGIFRRAYIRAYAQFIGLDPDVIVREFLEVHPDPGDLIVSTVAAAAAAEEEYAKQAPAMRFRSLVGSAFGSLTRLGRPGAGDLRPGAEPVATAPSLDELGPTADAAFTPDTPPSELAFVPDASRAELAIECEQPAESMTAADAVESGPEVQAAPVPEAPAAGEPDAEVPATPVHPGSAALASTVVVNQPTHDPTLETVAWVCTELGRVVERDAVRELLRESAAAVNAAGLIVWLADDSGEVLRPGLIHGYSDRVLAQLPGVTRDADNATAAAFRTGKACEVAATARTSGALVVPLLIPEGCAGVFAIELKQGVQPNRSVRAVAVLLAAALTQLVHRSRPAERPAPMERPAPVERQAPAVAEFRAAARPMKVRRQAPGA